MAAASPALRADDLDIRVFDADGVPVIAGDVQQRPLLRQERIQELQEKARSAGFPFALFVDLTSTQLFDLSAGKGAPPIFEMPTRALLKAYTSGIAEEKVSWQYLQRLVDTWFRNILLPIPDAPEAPGLDRLRALGLLSRIEGGEAHVKLGDYFLILYVETHWILSCVQAEEGEALDLLDPASSLSDLRVYLPAFCIAEAITRIRTKEQEAKQLRAQLEVRRRAVQTIRHGEARRFLDAFEDTVRKQDELIGVLSSEFNAFIEHVFASKVEFIRETYTAIKRANGYIRDLKMSRGDAIVLAMVIGHADAQEGPRKAFVSGDQKAFGREMPATAELAGAGIKCFSSVKNALGWLSAKEK